MFMVTSANRVRGAYLASRLAPASTGSFGRGLVAGFIGSLALLIGFAGAFATALALAHLPLPAPWPGWFMALTRNSLIDRSQSNLYAAIGLFFSGGLMWSYLYCAYARDRLHGSAWWCGVRFSILPWLVSLVALMPLVGGGFLGLALGAGPLPILGNLVLHVIYGAVVGLVSGTFGDRRVDGDPGLVTGTDAAFQRTAETGAGAGLLLGLLAGTGAGVVMAALGLPLGPVPGAPALATVIPLALLCGAGGMVLGTFMDL
jgi:hypothetical protein